MDPVSVISLVSSSIGVADIVTRLGFGLRHLQQQFSGALDHVDNITQQTSTIDLAIREICSFVNKSPNTFPASFESRLKESTTAIDKVVGQIQQHTESVKNEAEKSPSKGKLLHLRHADKVVQWENNLGVQIQALSLLLQVAQLRSNDERTSALEQDSSKKLFEKASSMSAKVYNSSRIPSSERPCPTDTTSFSFDPTLLQTKVYRRACESVWRRVVTLNGEDGGEDTIASTSSISSNHAAPSQPKDLNAYTLSQTKRICDKSSPSLKPETNIGLETRRITASENCEHLGIANCLPQLLSETSTTGTTNITTNSSDACATVSTLATTVSSIAHPKETTETLPKSNRSVQNSTILVIVEKAGSEDVEFPISQLSHHYDFVCDTIPKVRDRILLTCGIDPATYQGSLAQCTIETCGDATHKFPFTSSFLRAALEKVEEGFYSSIEVMARFEALNSLNDDHTVAQTIASRREGAITTEPEKCITATRKPLTSPSDVPRFVISEDNSLPVYQQTLIAKGGFSDVYKVKFRPSQNWFLDYDPKKFFALKSLHHNDKTAFENEVYSLQKFSSQPNIIKLLATFECDSEYHFVFPWASGNLREFWKGQDRFEADFLGSVLTERDSTQTLLWVAEQCAGIVEALREIHHIPRVKPQKVNIPEKWLIKDAKRSWHGDIKPENILWFNGRDTESTYGTLKISDFGLSQCRVKETRKRYCTPAYRAPEYDMANKPMSWAYDIWALGCVFLEFLTWFEGGWSGVEAFRQNRRIYAKDDAFFISENQECSLNPSVAQQLKLLQVKATSFRSPLRENLLRFLVTITLCLEISEDKRPLAETLAKQLSDLYTRMNEAMALKRRSGESWKEEERIVKEDFQLLFQDELSARTGT